MEHDSSELVIERGEVFSSIVSFYLFPPDNENFHHILYYLRTHQFICDDLTTKTLKMLQIEADFYQLRELKELLANEISHRCWVEPHPTVVFRAIAPSQANSYFNQGWEYVDTYEDREHFCCIATGYLADANIRRNRCSVCQCGSKEEDDKSLGPGPGHVCPLMMVVKKIS